MLYCTHGAEEETLGIQAVHLELGPWIHEGALRRRHTGIESFQVCEDFTNVFHQAGKPAWDIKLAYRCRMSFHRHKACLNGLSRSIPI